MRIKRKNSVDIKIKIMGVDINIINGINKIISVSKTTTKAGAHWIVTSSRLLHRNILTAFSGTLEKMGI